MSSYYSSSRSLRASSALPDSLHRGRIFDNVDPIVSRSLSVARELLEEPSIKSPIFKDIHSTKETIDEVKKAFRRSDDYWLGRYTDTILRGYAPESKTFVSVTGRRLPFSVYSPSRRLFPSSYWSYYPYSSTLPPFSSYGKKNYPLNDYLNDNYGHDPYYSHWYNHRGPFLRYPNTDWRAQNPTANKYSSYRPRYTPTIRRYYY